MSFGYYLIGILTWVAVGLGYGVLCGWAARAICQRRGMYQLGERAFKVCLVCGLVGVSFIVAVVFCVTAYIRDTDVGGYRAPAPAPYAAVHAPAGALRLVCVAGPLSGQSYILGRGALTIGTDPSNTVHLPQGTPGVSRRHCCIRWQNSAPQLVDLGSSYGTFLSNGRRLPPQYPTELGVGSRFYLGTNSCLFQLTMG